MKRIKATEVVILVCLVMACLLVPRFVTIHLLSEVGDVDRYSNFIPQFPEGGWLEQVIRVGLIALAVGYAVHVAQRLDGRTSWWETVTQKIKAKKIGIVVCLLAAAIVVPRPVTALLFAIFTALVPQGQVLDEAPTRALMAGGWFEWVLRIGLIGLTVWYAFHVAKRIDRESLPGGEDKGRRDQP